ncbi:hypothetical protein BGX38DRAFT_1210925, partial [Terfezia claveryi]
MHHKCPSVNVLLHLFDRLCWLLVFGSWGFRCLGSHLTFSRLFFGDRRCHRGL